MYFVLILSFLERKGNHHFSLPRKTERGGENMKEEKKEMIVVDPNGMYTGRPIDPDERPIQDADDL